jgi:hypothetical protein
LTDFAWLFFDPREDFWSPMLPLPAVPPNFLTLFLPDYLGDVGTAPKSENLIMNFPLAVAPDGNFVYRVAMPRIASLDSKSRYRSAPPQ